jgi:hypothetical protein
MKKIGFLTLLILATVLVTLAFSAAAAGPKAASQPVAAVPAPPVAVAPPDEPRPHIHAALEAMREAKRQLEAASHDYHGHRVESIKHLDQAIHEAEICEHEPAP